MNPHPEQQDLFPEDVTPKKEPIPTEEEQLDMFAEGEKERTVKAKAVTTTENTKIENSLGLTKEELDALFDETPQESLGYRKR